MVLRVTLGVKVLESFREELGIGLDKVVKDGEVLG